MPTLPSARKRPPPEPAGKSGGSASLSHAELNLLLGLGESLVTELDYDNVLAMVADAACEVVQAETLVVPIINTGSKTFSYRAGSGEYAAMIVGQTFPIHEGSCGWVLKHQRPLLFGLGASFNIDEEQHWQPGMASSLLVPLICRGVIIGGLSAMGKRGGGAFDQRDLVVLTLFANQAGIAIDNARIFHELRSERDKAEITLHAIADAVITTDTGGYVTYVNAAGTRMCDCEAADLIGQPLLQTIGLAEEASGEAVADPVAVCLRAAGTVMIEGHIVLTGRRGRQVAIECVTSPVHDGTGQTAGVVLVLHDISEQRRLQSELTHQANFDALTGLANRRLFNNTLMGLLERAGEEGREHVLLYMDLDHFKIVNDTCGHLAGDILLSQIAALIQTGVRRNDMLARLGGDEFGLLLTDCLPAEALRVANNIIERVRAYRFSSHNRQFEIGVSIGMVPIDALATDIEQLLSRADLACYSSKQKGGNYVSVYDSTSTDLDRLQGEMLWIPRLRSALNDDRFTLYVQPIVPIQTKPELHLHYEVLLRMLDEQGQLVPPGHFLPVAERYHMVQEIDRWTFDQVLRQLAAFPTGAKVPSVSVNLSGASVGSDKFRDYVLGRLIEAKLPPACLCVEITETSAIENLLAVAKFIEQLRALGCSTSLDDFGSGLCSFGYLKELPVDYLKIDGQLVRRVGESDLELGMVEAINRIAQLLGKKTVAEWIEDDATRDRLQAIGVDYGQGYGLGRPLPWAEVFTQTY